MLWGIHASGRMGARTRWRQAAVAIAAVAVALPVSVSATAPASAAVSYVVTATIPVGSSPQGIAVDPTGTHVYVANNGSDTVSVIDTATNTVTATIDVGAAPVGVAVDPTGTQTYVTNNGSDTVSVINTATNTVTATIDVGAAPVGVAVDPTGTHAYVTNNGSDTVSVINTATNTVTATIDVGTFPVGVAVNPAMSRAYVANVGFNTVSVIDTGTNSVIATIEPPHIAPQGVAVDPTGSHAYVTSQGRHLVAVIDTASDTETLAIPIGGEAFGVAVDPTGSHVCVTIPLLDSVSVIDTATNTVTATIPVGSSPQGVAVDPTGSHIYVTNADSGTVSVISVIQPPPPPPVPTALAITTTGPLPGGTAGHHYTAMLQATGGLPPYTWSIAHGALPPRLRLGPATGTITGTPTTAGARSFTVQVTDSAGRTAQATLTIDIKPGPHARLAITLRHKGLFRHGHTGTYRLRVTNTTATPTTGTITVTIAVPAGLTFTRAHGRGWRCARRHHRHAETCGHRAPLRGHQVTMLTLRAHITAPAGRIEPALATLSRPHRRRPGTHRTLITTGSADLGHDLGGDQFQVVEVVQVEDLQVHPGRAGRGEPAELVHDPPGRPGQAAAFQVGDVAADRGRPPPHLRVGPPAAHHLACRVHQRRRIAARGPAGVPHAAERGSGLLGTDEHDVELVSEPRRERRGPAWPMPADQDRGAWPLCRPGQGR